MAEAARGVRGGVRAKVVKEEAEEGIDGSRGERRRCRNLSDVSVRSSRKGRTWQGKKARLVEDDDDEVAGSTPDIVIID